MKHSHFSKARFAGAFLSESPPLFHTESGIQMPEIALIGRSNVGKSSLINHLCNNSKLAKTSSTPGKTQTLNFFIVNEAIALVDLPGYGYAKVPHKTKQNWASCLDGYLKTRPCISLLLLLLDSRHPPSEEDISFIQWALFQKKELLVIFTKTDKLSQAEKLHHTRHTLETLGAINHLYYSVKDPASKLALMHYLEQYSPLS